MKGHERRKGLRYRECKGGKEKEKKKYDRIGT